MQFSSDLTKIDGHVLMPIPDALVDVLHLAEHNRVGITVSHGRMIVEPAQKPRYTLEALLSQCDVSAPASAEECAWGNDNACGQEAL